MRLINRLFENWLPPGHDRRQQAEDSADFLKLNGWRPRFLCFSQALAYLIFVCFSAFILLIGIGLLLPLNHILRADTLDTFLWIEAIGAVSVLLATAAMSSWSSLSWRAAGYGKKDAFSDFAWGWLLGFAALSLIMLCLWLMGFVRFTGLHALGLKNFITMLETLILFLLVALTEEGLMRGPFLVFSARAFGFWPAAVLSSALFGLMHGFNPGETAMGVINAAFVGLIFALSRKIMGSLWLAMGFHAAWDFAQSYIYGVPDSGMILRDTFTQAVLSGSDLISGGKTGPEGGLICTFVLCLVLWLFHSIKGQGRVFLIPKV